MKKGLIDLHIHTTYSGEGIKTAPSEVIELALIKGVETLAITDHNTTMGCIAGLKYIERNPELCKDLNFITGIEISCDTTSVLSYRDEQKHLRSSLAGGIHLLGYGIDPYNEGFLDLARFYRSDTGKRTLAAYKFIRRFYGITVDKNTLYEVIKELENEISSGEYTQDEVSQELLARALTTGRNAPLGRKNQYENFCKSVIKRDKQTYNDYLYRIRKLFAVSGDQLDEMAKQDIYEMMDLIERAGGVAVLAHPTFYRPKRELSVADFELLSEFIDKVTGHYNEYTGEFMRGIVGIELLHGSSFDDQFRFKFYDNIIKNKGLFITGGSDSHITNVKSNNLGYIRHNFSIKHLDFVDRLDEILALSQRATSIKKQKERDCEILKGAQAGHKSVDEQAILFNDYKAVKAREIIEGQTISKKLLSFENEISAVMFALKEKLFENEDVEKSEHKNPKSLQEWTSLYAMYMKSIIENQDVFFGDKDVFYDWLQHRLEFVNQACDELYDLSALDANVQMENNSAVDNPHFKESKRIMNAIADEIEQESASYCASKVMHELERV